MSVPGTALCLTKAMHSSGLYTGLASLATFILDIQGPWLSTRDHVCSCFLFHDCQVMILTLNHTGSSLVRIGKNCRMGKIFKFLGMSVAVATDHMLNSERRVPFAADVTYVTAQVLCFTYLFDNTTQTKNYTVSPSFAADVICVTAQVLCFMYLFDNTTQTKNYTVSCAFAADVTCVTAQIHCFTYLFDNTMQTKNYTVSCAFAADVTYATAQVLCFTYCTRIGTTAQSKDYKGLRLGLGF